jgi:surface protein
MDLPNLTQVTFMSHMFNGCTNLNGPTNIGSWNTANVTNMRTIFFNATAFNQNIGSWNTANVLSFQEVFYNAAAFNHRLNYLIRFWRNCIN